MSWHRPDENLEARIRLREHKRMRNWQIGMVIALLLAGAVCVQVLILGRMSAQAAERFPKRSGFSAQTSNYGAVLSSINPSFVRYRERDAKVSALLEDDVVAVADEYTLRLEALYTEQQELFELCQALEDEVVARSEAEGWSSYELAGELSNTTQSLIEQYDDVSLQVYLLEEEIVALKRDGYRRLLTRQQAPQIALCIAGTLVAVGLSLWWLARRHRKYTRSELWVRRARCVEREILGGRRSRSYHLNFEMDGGGPRQKHRVTRYLYRQVGLGRGVLMVKAGGILRIYPDL